MLLIALLGCIVAANAQFIPGLKPVCGRDDVIAGVNFLPHEKYAQWFYICNLEYQYQMLCPDGSIWNTAINNCLPPAAEDTKNGRTSAANWECAVGRNYPDLCCNQYWTCVNNVWTRRSCPADQVLDVALGQCRSGIACNNEYGCLRSFVPNNVNIPCPYSANVNDPCKFNEGDVVKDCGPKTIWSQSKCTCDQDVQNQCSYPAAGLLANKNFDPNCNPSYRVMFSNGRLEAFSDKLQQSLGTGFLAGTDIRLSNNEIVFTGSNSYIYSYFLAGNEYASPTAFSIIFKPDDINVNQGQTFTLLSNQYDSTDGNLDDMCAPTLLVTATSNPRNNLNSLRNWQFNIQVRSPAGAQDSFSVTASASANNWLRFTMTYTKGLESFVRVSVSDLGINNIGNNPQVIGSGQSNQQIEAFPYNLCGLTVGRNFVGRMSQVNIYEGCGNGFQGF